MPAERPSRLRPDRSGPGRRAFELLVRVGCGLVLGLLCRGITEIPYAAGDQLGLDLVGAGAFLAGLYAGWLAPLGFWLGDLAVSWLVHGTSARLELLPPYLILGAGGFAAFRFVYRVDRRLPDLRSFLTLLGAAALFAWPASALIVVVYFPGFSWTAVAVWYAAVVATIALLAPAALLLCPSAIWRQRERLAKEEALRPARSHGESARLLSDSSSGIRIRRPARPLVDALAVVAAVLAIRLSVLAAGSGGGTPFSHWLFLLYSLPILFAAYRRGLRGGLLAAAAVGVSLLFSTRPGIGIRDWHLSTVELQIGVVLFALFGAVAGATRDREKNLQRQLERSNRTLRQDLERVLAALRSAMEAKDQYTEGHLRRVCDFAVEVGRRLKLEEAELELLEIASLLHDVGKIGIADSVLRKPGPLDPRERELMQRHPAIGARILENVEGLKEAAEMVRHHQERFDGMTIGEFPGYPDGLAGREIPLGARIIAVVDAFDAMTSDRPYRDSIGLERAKQALRAESGRQFDPRVVETFLSLVEERDWERSPVEVEDANEAAG